MHLDHVKQNTSLIEKAKWSQELKSDKIAINGNVVTQTQKSNYDEFSLLDCGFSHLFRRKQCWKVRIIKKKGGIEVGICLRNEMQKKNFNSQQIRWQKIGHGLYLIGAGGYCLSHSQQELNRVFKSFKFNEEDVINISYDPTQWLVKFRLNQKGPKFQLSMSPPPEDDCYHPCILLGQMEDSVELILDSQHVLPS